MRILLLSSFLPHPLFTGGHIRLFNLIRELSKRHDITLLCERRDYQKEEDVAALEKICKTVITFRRKKQWSFENLFKTAFSTYSFLMVGHTNSDIRKKVEELLQKEKFDLLHIETFYVAQNIPEIKSLPTVLVDHNIEYLVYRRYAKTLPFFTQPFIYFDTLKMKYWENYFWKKVTKLVAVSEDEKRLMGRPDVAVVPNGVDLKNFKCQISNAKFQKKDKKILFIGDFRWVQNRDAVEWLLKEIWPAVAKALADKPKAKLWIVGKNIPDYIKKLTLDKNVFFDENASKKTSEIFRSADVLLAPIRVGGGTSFKILEAMASGVPVVTTPLGIEGIEAKEGEEVLIGRESGELAGYVSEILQNENLYQKISKNARALIEKKYDWEKITQKLEKVYISAVGNYG